MAKAKNRNKKEELPSFLKDLTSPPEEMLEKLKPKTSDNYFGPIFFGKCIDLHPPHHSIHISAAPIVHHTTQHKENILKDLFIKRPSVVKERIQTKEFHPLIRHKKVFVDTWPHKCPGSLKTAPRGVTELSCGVGKTPCTIEKETCREIPFCRFKRRFVRGIGKLELEVVTLSDIWEEQRKYMTYCYRIAHTHFPKEFANIPVFGPPIPASIIITKLPSKRNSPFDTDFFINPCQYLPRQKKNKETSTQENKKSIQKSISSKKEIKTPCRETKKVEEKVITEVESMEESCPISKEEPKETEERKPKKSEIMKQLLEWF